MREFGFLNPFRLFSGGKLLLLLGALMATLISVTVAFSPTAGAADATWEEGRIVYEDKSFRLNDVEGIHDEIDVPDGAAIYQHGGGSGDSTAEFIYFANPDSVSTAETAQYLKFDWNHQRGQVSNRDGPHTITIDVQATTPGATNEETSSCEVDAIGWLICPVTNFLAKGTDWLFDRLTSLLAVPPLFGDTDSPLYRIWQMMLGLANLAFIIFFLIIIYSQITSVGISNYGVKRLLPRLIIAAIGVNVSYYICAVAVDISNILGFSLQEMFFNMRNEVVQVDNGNGWQIHSFEDIATVVLSGSIAGAAALGIAANSLLATGVTSAIIMLLPVLVGVGLAILVAILILAARQAVITVLIILSPLAIVAYLLPNTEKWFEKWRSLFMTMLLLFPVFSVLFGGAQLAGTAIIQNAGSLDVIILGMATQVAPLVITPFLIKFSGSLLGRIAGMVNNPNKGLIDRSRNFAKERAERSQAKRTAGLMGNPPKRRQVFRRAGRSAEMRKRMRESELETWKQEADRGYEQAKGTDSKIQQVDLRLKLANLETENFKQDSQRRLDELRAGHRESISIQPERVAASALVRAQNADREGRILSNQIREAQSQQLSNFSNELADNETLRIRAGGVAGFEGAQSVYTNAISAIRKEYNDNVAERTQLIRHFNLSSTERQELALGSDVTKTHNGRTFTFRAADIYAREAAIEDQLKTGSEKQIQQIIAESGAEYDSGGNIIKQGRTFDFRTTVSQAIPGNGIPGKALIFGNKTIDDVSQGRFYGEKSLFNAAVYNIAEGKIRDDVLAVQGGETLRILYEAGERLKRDPSSIEQFNSLSEAKKKEFWLNYESLQRSAYKILEDPVNRNATESARKIFKKYQVKAEKDDLP